MKKLILFISALMLLAGCEKDDEKVYYITFITNAYQEKYEITPYDVTIKDKNGDILAKLESSDGGAAHYDHEGNMGDPFYIYCDLGPVNLHIGSYNSTHDGEYMMQTGDKIIAQIDIE